MLGIRSQYRAQSSIPQTIREDTELDDELEDMELCDENEFDKGLILLGSKSQKTLRELYRLIVKRDSLKIRVPMQREMDLVFTEILNQDNFGNYGESNYEIMLPYEIFMIENVHYKGLVRFKNILNLPNKIRSISFTNKNSLRKSTQLINTTITDYINWLIQQTFNTHEEKRAHLKLFKSEYIVITKTTTTSKTQVHKMPSDELVTKSNNHLIFNIDIFNSTVSLNVYDEGKLFKLIKFNLKRDFARIQKFQNQIDIEFSLKMTLFIEMARKEMINHI